MNIRIEAFSNQTGEVSKVKTQFFHQGHTVDGSEIRLTSWYGKYPIICKVSYMSGG